MMFAVCLSAFCFIMSSSYSGMPISGTHSVVGALLGAGVVGSSASELNWKELIFIVGGWIASPILSGTFSCILMTLVATFTL
jgi:PiT family inorganic phosphate transporter